MKAHGQGEKKCKGAREFKKVCKNLPENENNVVFFSNTSKPPWLVPCDHLARGAIYWIQGFIQAEKIRFGHRFVERRGFLTQGDRGGVKNRRKLHVRSSALPTSITRGRGGSTGSDKPMRFLQRSCPWEGGEVAHALVFWEPKRTALVKRHAHATRCRQGCLCSARICA